MNAPIDEDKAAEGFVILAIGTLIGTAIGLICYGCGLNEHLSWGIGILTMCAVTYLVGKYGS